MHRLRDARALIFDLDGTLVDSLDDIALHLNAMLAARGLPTRNRAEIAEWVGYGAVALVARAVPDTAEVPEALAQFRANYRAQPVVNTHLYAAIDAVLDAVAPRQLAVLSNKPHDLTVAVVDALLRRWPFAVVVGQRAGEPHKPDPAALHDVARALGVAADACVMIGDSEVDLATARAASAPSIAVTWGMRPRQLLVDAEPDYLVDTPRQLAALFA
jgi:phosphoglycolate phosphatase